MKIAIALFASMLAVPVAAQTTTNCHAVVFGQPQYGIVCDTVPNGVPQQQAPTLDWANPNYADQERLRQREADLQRREEMLRQRERGVTPSTRSRILRGLFGSPQ